MSFISIAVFAGTVLASFVKPMMAVPVYAALYGLARRGGLLLRAAVVGSMLVFMSASLWLQERSESRMSLTRSVCPAVFNGKIEAVQDTASGQRLDIRVIELKRACPEASRIKKVRVSSGSSADRFSAGQVGVFSVRLRSPRGFRNRLPFDYEGYLMAAGIDALGSLRKVEDLTAAPEMNVRSVNPWVSGLVFGRASGFTDSQWALARETGTLHLLVVSGLHLSLVAIVGFVAGIVVHRLLLIILPVTEQGWVVLPVMILSVLVYGMQAGLGLSLQRGLVMIALAMLLLFRVQRISAGFTVAVAWSVLLLVNPLIWLNAGFWYSFVAVAALVLYFSGRKNTRTEGLWLPQWVVFWAVLPVSLFWLQTVSFSNVLANVVAVPLVSLSILPLALFQSVLQMGVSDQVLTSLGEMYWSWLVLVDGFRFGDVAVVAIGSLAALVAVLACLQAGYPGVVRMTVLVLCMSGLALFRPASEDQASMLDVGQGLAVMFVADGKSLVYDTGARYRSGFSLGRSVLGPALLKSGLSSVDAMVVSHEDNDHSGGMPGLREVVSVGETYAGQAIDGESMRLCEQAHQQWRSISANLVWRILRVSMQNSAGVDDNNASCVVQVDWYGRRFLLTGDIGVEVEQALVARYGEELASQVLVVAHHGSRSSTSLSFLRAVGPAEAWVSAGFANRFGHPHPEVVNLLLNEGIVLRNTAEVGRMVMDRAGVVTTDEGGLKPRWVNQ